MIVETFEGKGHVIAKNKTQYRVMITDGNAGYINWFNMWECKIIHKFRIEL